MKEDLSDLDDAFVIIGGGGIIHLPSPDYNNGIFGHLEELKNIGKYRVLWGAGHNVYFPVDYSGDKFPSILDDQAMCAINTLPNLSTFDLVGLRDTSYLLIKGARRVPCVSCKSPLFKKVETMPGIGIGAVLHEGSESTEFPQIYCEKSTFSEVTEFIRHFETIVTDSYHAMYWSELLNKKVIFHNVHSTKFLLHRIESLQRCAARNDMFYNNVMELVMRYMND